MTGANLEAGSKFILSGYLFSNLVLSLDYSLLGVSWFEYKQLNCILSKRLSKWQIITIELLAIRVKTSEITK